MRPIKQRFYFFLVERMDSSDLLLAQGGHMTFQPVLKLDDYILLFLPLRVNPAGHVNHLAKRPPRRKTDLPEDALRRWEE